MNIKQLSIAIGISTTTISRALNGYPEVNIKTRKRVEEAAKKYGYAPCSVAKRLVGKKVEAVGVIQPMDVSISGSFTFMEMVRVLSESLYQGKMDLFIFPSDRHQQTTLYERMIAAGRVDSFVVESTQRYDPRIENLLQKNIPFFSFGRSQVSGEYSWFDIDYCGGSMKACSALLARGHRRIAYLHRDSTLNSCWERLQGFKQSLMDAPESQAMIIDTCVSEDAAQRSAIELLSLGKEKRPSAIICSNMQSAKGVAKALEVKGLRHGRDVSIVAWDDGIADISIPGMSVVDASVRRGSERLAEMLLNSANDGNNSPVQELQDAELKLDASVGVYQ